MEPAIALASLHLLKLTVDLSIKECTSFADEFNLQALFDKSPQLLLGHGIQINLSQYCLDALDNHRIVWGASATLEVERCS